VTGAIGIKKGARIRILECDPEVVLTRADAYAVPVQDGRRFTGIIDKQVQSTEVGVHHYRWKRSRLGKRRRRLQTIDVVLHLGTTLDDPWVIEQVAKDGDTWLGDRDGWGANERVVVNQSQGVRSFPPIVSSGVPSREERKKPIRIAMRRHCRKPASNRWSRTRNTDRQCKLCENLKALRRLAAPDFHKPGAVGPPDAFPTFPGSPQLAHVDTK